MATWKKIHEEHPEFAEAVEQRFDAFRHKVMATLRRDGSPRISGIEMEFANGEVRLGMMPGSLKARDLMRDPRLALHSGTENPPDKPASGDVVDAKLAGRAVEMATPDDSSGDGGHRPHYFSVDVAEAVLISIGDPADHLVIETWSEGKGLKRVKRY